MAAKKALQGRLRELLSGLALLALTTAVMVVGIEVVSRVKLGDKAPYSTRGMLRPSDSFPYPLHEWTPGARGVYRGLAVDINMDGFIGPDYSEHPADGTERIIVIGDSIAAGWGLDTAADSFANRLEEHLRHSGRRAEVLNLAVPGYDAYESVMRLQHLGLRFQPDIVIYLLCLNDMLHAAGRPTPEATRAANYARRSPLWHLTWWRFRHLRKIAAEGRHIPYATIVGDEWLPPSEDETLDQLHSEIGELGDPGFFRDRDDGYDPWLGIGHFEYAMRQLASMSVEHGFHTLVVEIPYLVSEVSAGRELANQIADHIVDKYSLPHIDLRPVFQALGFRELKAFDWDHIHPNARGHEAMASAVEPLIQPWLASVD